jgi:hypothetical protein
MLIQVIFFPKITFFLNNIKPNTHITTQSVLSEENKPEEERSKRKSQNKEQIETNLYLELIE